MSIKKRIAQIIQTETKGGYLEDWKDTAKLLTKEQQDDYFNILTELILKQINVMLKNLEQAGYRLVPKELDKHPLPKRYSKEELDDFSLNQMEGR